MKTIYYLSPSSFCFGVEKSIKELNKIINSYQPTGQAGPGEHIFCVHAIVHNPKVTKDFESKGVTFIESIDDIQDPKAVVVFSAHGTNRVLINEAKKRFKAVYNLECPFVSKIYHEVDGYIAKGIRLFFYIGKEHHQEGKNIIEYIKSLDAQVHVFEKKEEIPDLDQNVEFGVLSQTTLNFAYVQTIIDTITKKYPKADIPSQSDVCKATYERQKVILENLDKFNAFIVIGGKQSNNTKELYQIGLKNGKASFYGESLDDIVQKYNDELLNYDTVALTGGASTPAEDIKAVFDYFHQQGYEKKVLVLG